MKWLVGTGVALVAVAGLRWLMRRAAFSATGKPTPNEAKAEARAGAQEVLHAPGSVVDARVNQLRARGRAGK